VLEILYKKSIKLCVFQNTRWNKKNLPQNNIMYIKKKDILNPQCAFTQKYL